MLTEESIAGSIIADLKYANIVGGRVCLDRIAKKKWEAFVDFDEVSDLEFAAIGETIKEALLGLRNITADVKSKYKGPSITDKEIQNLKGVKGISVMSNNDIALYKTSMRKANYLIKKCGAKPIRDSDGKLLVVKLNRDFKQEEVGANHPAWKKKQL